MQEGIYDKFVERIQEEGTSQQSRRPICCRSHSKVLRYPSYNTIVLWARKLDSLKPEYGNSV